MLKHVFKMYVQVYFYNVIYNRKKLKSTQIPNSKIRKQLKKVRDFCMMRYYALKWHL